MSVELKLNNLVIPVDHFTFKGGEEQVKIDLNHAPKGSIGFVDITAKIKNSTDVMALAMLVDACSRLENLDVHAEFTLNLPYIPYARQDRVMQPGEALSIKVFANIINSLGFDKVIVDDPHSDVSAALLNNVKIRGQHQLVSEVKALGQFLNSNFVVVAPDAGARKKAQKVADGLRLPLVEAGKVRDVRTGEITGTAVFGDVTGRKCLIVDDIIDGGRTFIALAQALKEKGADYVVLYGTHGIFSYGKQVILEGGVDEIYAYHDWTENF
ncbi:TPA: ribose-phosphate pyrophosphokinase [Klebsiella pneumoniae]|nr:ribose-phosphate pyrophosphokinase [Klebsiella pneumoniae]